MMTETRQEEIPITEDSKINLIRNLGYEEYNGKQLGFEGFLTEYEALALLKNYKTIFQDAQDLKFIKHGNYYSPFIQFDKITGREA